MWVFYRIAQIIHMFSYFLQIITLVAGSTSREINISYKLMALMTRTIAFHSYKGGTGKSTIASNLATRLVSEGHTVALLDLDVYAPSLYAYFDFNPDKWINDFLAGNAKVPEVVVDMTPVVERFSTSSDKKAGKFLIGFSNPQKEEIYKLDGFVSKQEGSRMQLLRNFIQLREELISDYNCDYVIIDTSPGIRYWSINSLALADTIFLTLKFGELDIEGTKKMADGMYDSFTKFGAKSFLLLNRVSGYCVPNMAISDVHLHEKQETIPLPPAEEPDIGSSLSKEVRMDLIAAVPCYCDIQFSRKEFLTVLQHPDHPFSKQVCSLSKSEHIKLE